MKPQTNAPANTTRPTMMPPQSEADKKAEEARTRSEMMKPQTGGPSATGQQHRMNPPQSAADRKAAETQKKSEMMKPQ